MKFALPGHQVRLVNYTPGHLGYASQREELARYLTIGQIYTVQQTRIFASSSLVELVEVPGVSFNTVFFKSVTPQSRAQDEQHPDYIRYREARARRLRDESGT
jgi:hypothetical protein